MQTEHRRTPYPWMWEPAAGTAITVALVLLVGAQLARAAANWQAGARWMWPRNPLTGIGGLLAGDAGAGLDIRGPVADTAALYGWLAAVEATALVLLAAAAIWAFHRWGPGHMKGMATHAEAEATLGVSRLRKVRRVVRPDRYGPTASAPATRAADWTPAPLADTTWTPNPGVRRDQGR